MALFRIEKGLSSNLKTKRPNAVEGYAYFTTDDGKFYIDIANGTAEEYVNRIPLNAVAADKWVETRSLDLTGDVSGSTEIDGTADMSITVSVKDDSHNHTILHPSKALTTQNLDTIWDANPMFKVYYTGGTTTTTNTPSGVTAYGLLTYPSANTYRMQELFSSSGIKYARFRNSNVASGTWSAWKQFAFIDDNVASATKLKNSRNFSITGLIVAPEVSFNGESDVVLQPTAVKATSMNHNVTVNGTSSTWSAGTNITTAIWGTERQLSICSSDGTGVGTTTSVNGSANYTLKLPSTIKATITGNASTATALKNGFSLEFNGQVIGTSSTIKGNETSPISITLSLAKKYAGSASDGGSAISAVKLDTATAGDATHPIYWTGGKPAQCNGTLANNISGSAARLTTARNIYFGGDVTLNEAVTFDGSKDVTFNLSVGNDSHTHGNGSLLSLDAAKITSGTIGIDRLPQGALERLIVVATIAERDALTESQVQAGDVVKVDATDTMYYVRYDNNTRVFEPFAAGRAASVRWANIEGVPTLSLIGNAQGSIALTGEPSGGIHNLQVSNIKAKQMESNLTINGLATNLLVGGTYTTTNWGTARNISIASSDGTGAGTAVSVNGSQAYTLRLPTSAKMNASTASKWQTKRTITLGTDVSGSAEIDGSADVTINVSVKDDSHNHTEILYKSLTNTDLNTLYSSTNNWFRVYTAAGGNTCTNLPSGLAAGTAFGMLSYPTAGGYRAQEMYTQYGIKYARYRNGTASSNTWSTWKQFAFIDDNVASATKLQTARNFSISGLVTAPEVSFNGEGNVVLQPTAVKATSMNHNVTVNGTTSNWGSGANITTAKWGTARNIQIADSDKTNTGTAVSVNGSQAYVLLLPATIKATLSGNAATATKISSNTTIELNGDVTGSVATQLTAGGTSTITTTCVKAGQVKNSLTLKYTDANAATTTKTFNGSSAVTFEVKAADLFPVYTFTKSIQLNTSWQDIGINGDNIPTAGSYCIQIYLNDSSVSGAMGHYFEYYTGMMSWYPSTTNSSDSDELILHKAGHASNAKNLFLRTVRDSSTGSVGKLKMQIAANVATTAASTLVIKVRQII